MSARPRLEVVADTDVEAINRIASELYDLGERGCTVAARNPRTLLRLATRYSELRGRRITVDNFDVLRAVWLKVREVAERTIDDCDGQYVDGLHLGPYAIRCRGAG